MNTELIIITGAGIAGLSLAIQLAENKIPCLILEKNADFSEATSGVRISTQGVQILERMKIKNIGAKMERVVLHFGKMKADFKIRYPEGHNPAIIVTRLAVYEQLMERVKSLGIKVITAFHVSDVIQHPDGVEAVSDNGQRIRGRFLIGADGVGSTIRKLVNPGQHAGKRYAGYLGVGLITPNNMKIPLSLSLYQNHKNHVGVASIGKIRCNDKQDNLFLWTHLYMPEADAKAITNDTIMRMLEAKSKGWHLSLNNIFEGCKKDPHTVVTHVAVYNGKVPNRWFSKNIILMGDAAHPYGPGGQGISMALKDAEALCALFCSGEVNEEKLERFQQTRAKEARKHGESAARRNKPSNPFTSRWRVFFRACFMKSYHFFNRGVLNAF